MDTFHVTPKVSLYFSICDVLGARAACPLCLTMRKRAALPDKKQQKCQLENEGCLIMQT